MRVSCGGRGYIIRTIWPGAGDLIAIGRRFWAASFYLGKTGVRGTPSGRFLFPVNGLGTPARLADIGRGQLQAVH
jgi:hypothetical protein